MNEVVLFFIFISSSLILYKSSEWTLRYSLILSRKIGISTVVFGLIIVAISTSLPELMVAVSSIISRNVGLSVGNLLGANFINLTLVLGISVLPYGIIYLKKKEEKDIIELLFLSTLVTLIIFQGQKLSVIHGIILLVLFGLLISKLYRGGRIKKDFYDTIDESVKKIILLFIISLSLLLLSSHLLVFSALNIADIFALTATFIGMTITSVGTTLPELSIQLRAIKNKEYGLAIGDLLGSCVVNLTLILGFLSILSPVSIEATSLLHLIPFLFIAIFVVWYAIANKKKFTRFEGIILMILYLLFILESFSII
ncbi:MAG TPA: sodium:calcium antiporter [Candidatus Aenigmarchaeota archaeon]|nr:sodium:calcium antiporter [Candidatus Aenigmarchaeota archaeon]